MKGSKASFCVAVLLSVATLLGVGKISPKLRYSPGDLRLRYNESLCAHKGVNPFHIWNHDVSSDEFIGWPRPDYDPDPCADTWEYASKKGKKVVHAYPPWHMAYTWFFGKMPFPCVSALIYLLYGLALSALVKMVMTYRWKHKACLFWSFVVFNFAVSIVYCLKYGNYGIICAGLLLCMITMLNWNEVLVGVCWGLMMVKPQVAALLIFPLLFQKKFIAIAVAVLMCVLGTLFMSHVYGESPLDLIMQVPQIAAPYETTSTFKAVIPHSLYPFAKHCWTAICVAFCAYCSWRWRDAEDPVFRFAPVALLFPLWLYSQPHDYIAAWPYVLLVASILPRMFAAKKARWLAWTYLAYIGFAPCFDFAWGHAVQYGVFSPTGIGWIYRAVMCPASMLYFFFGVYVLSKRPSFWGL